MEKIAAIFARVSDPKQEEPSLDRQVATVKAWLEEQGFEVPEDKIIKVVWTSKKILNCPQMQTLLGWVRTSQVQAVGMTHLDRLSARPAHMFQIFETLKEANCQLLAKDTPLPAGLMGEMVAMVITLGKAMQVDRADNGAKSGLIDRVTRRRLPASGHRIYGYRWAAENRLEPDPEHPEHYETLELIFDMASKRATYHAIQRELKRRGIPSPRGNLEWDRSTIAYMVSNPVYAGRYYGLKSEACEPKTRKVIGEGNTSNRNLSLDQATYLPEVKITAPLITWEQFQKLQERRQRNKELAQRNAKRNYLLRGLVLCETHRSKHGEPRKYFGQPRNKSYKYSCPVGGCSHQDLNGPRLENQIKQLIRSLLTLEPEEFYERIANQATRQELRESLQRELKSLDDKLKRNINAETELENRSLMGREHPEVYRRLKTRYQTERSWIEERTRAINEQTTQLNREAEAVGSWKKIKERYFSRIDDLTDSEWRELFIALNIVIPIGGDTGLQSADIRLASPDATISYFQGKRDFEELMKDRPTSANIEVRVGLSLDESSEPVSNIVFKTPQNLSSPSPLKEMGIKGVRLVNNLRY